MRWRWCVAILAAALMLPELVSAQAVPGARQADRHNPFSDRYIDMMPGGLQRRGGASSSGSSGSSSGGVVIGGYYPPWYGGWGYPGDPYYGYGYPGYFPPYYLDPGYGDPLGPYVLPPVTLPAETLYGPQRQWQFLGAPQQQPPRTVIVAPPAAADGLADRARVQPTNGEVRARAGRFLDAGDQQFRDQRYYESLQRYKQAAQAAFDMPDSYFRQGQALVALGKYDQAAKAFRRGLDLDPTWPQSGFRLEALYGQNRAAQGAHLDALAKAAEDNPRSADLLFLVGIQLYFGGQLERSQQFFERAAALAGPQAQHLDGFLKRLEERKQAVPPGGGGIAF